ncbi:ArsR family transcriptional regulator [Fusobacterium varium]|jgi:DNA-binding transcriptional ArsR family regulator|nr:MAG TPA: Putative TetR-family transcriptional regulator [Caudoviricetes sp.]
MVNKKRLEEKLSRISFSELASHLQMTRGNLYYHYNKLKKGELTFKTEIIEKISLFISDRDDIFFEE